MTHHLRCRNWNTVEGLYSGHPVAERDRGLLVRLPAEQELKDTFAADGKGYGGTAEGGDGTARDAKGEELTESPREN